MRNDEIIRAARAFRDAETTTGNMSTTTRVYSLGYLPERLSEIVNLHRDEITQVIYSYRTPIAWLHRGVWVVPAVSYSMTTSAKHQVHLWKLDDTVSIPADCSPEEYERVLSRKMFFGLFEKRTYPGPNYVPGE